MLAKVFSGLLSKPSVTLIQRRMTVVHRFIIVYFFQPIVMDINRLTKVIARMAVTEIKLVVSVNKGDR
ncbi:hypothetical protein DGG96_08355 [Legionella qingyii]|uniref:Uncharacterized protein n=1 Tax=Legionella qingyii TaxID=2184757 RepID=A0A317U4G3_9GAMM|nr:hypothetical protein DGG96_08355 [Legionella qingyii]